MQDSPPRHSAISFECQLNTSRGAAAMCVMGNAPILGAFPGILPGKMVRQDAEPCMLEASAPWKHIALRLDSTDAAGMGSLLKRNDFLSKASSCNKILSARKNFYDEDRQYLVD